MSETEISQQYCVRWNSHLCSLSTAFPQLLDQEKFVDVTLACEGQQVHCHKVVLAACSQYFDNLLSENPCKHPIIILPSDIKLWTIQALVEFMYKGQVNVSQAGLPDLVKSGDLLQIRGLCNTDITAGLTVQNNNNSAENSTAQVSKVVPTPNPPIAHMGNVARKEIGSGSPNKAHCGNNVPNDHSRSVSLDEEQQIKTEEIDEIGDEMEAEDPKNPENINKNSIDSTTITTIQASTSQSSAWQIRVKPNENLFENYKEPGLVEDQTKRDECEVIQISSDSGDPLQTNENQNIPTSLKYNTSVMEVKPVISGPAFSLMNIDEENFFNLRDDDDDDEEFADYDMQHEIPEVSISYGAQNESLKNLQRILPKQSHDNKIQISPISLRNPRGNQVRTYTEEALISALNEIKGGLSIYKASQKYRVPRKTLRNWMKRWQIKSAHPMPAQLQRAALRKKIERDQMLANYAMANVMVEYDDERRNDSLNDTMDGYDSIDNLGNRRIRRPEATLREAAQCVSRGETFQKVSTMFNIPISTIRFYMARKGILPRRKRGRCTIPTSQINGNTISSTTTHLDMSSGSIIGSGNNQFSDSNPTPSDFITQPTTSNALNLRRSRSTSPVEPPYHFANFKLPELRPKLV
uniref:CSON002451 protein n=1 Tax=Culicoides sonorensis TaxID=179676 RepID=A0A336LRU3_CULSO